jgi:hypothetical protein
LVQIDWQAIATLVTGFLAVGSAVFVGKRQLAILNRQATLSENDLKIQLLERRSACLEAIRAIWRSWTATTTLEDEQWGRLFDLLYEVQLLYPPTVFAQLDQAVTSMLRARRYNGQSQLHYRRNQNHQGDERLEAASTEEQSVMDALPRLLDELVNHTRIDAWH